MDANVQASLKTLLQDWMTQRQQALLEQVMLAWSEASSHLSPDEALLDSIRGAIPAPPPPPEPAPAPQAVPERAEALEAALDRLEDAGTQGEVLKQLLEGLQPFAGRSAIFVLKQGIASLFAQRGFPGEAPRTPVVPPADLEALLHGRTRLLGEDGEGYAALLGPLGAGPGAQARVLPLRLRRRVVALVLADSGDAPALAGTAPLRALVLAAEAKLSHLAGAKEEERAAASEVNPSTLTQRIPDAIAEPPAPGLDPKVRMNAERSARVLVGDIELYFPAKVAQGQLQGNLYAVLRDELDRSRASFVERYGSDLEDRFQIFYNTVVQQLCGGEASRLGPAPWVAAGHP